MMSAADSQCQRHGAVRELGSEILDVEAGFAGSSAFADNPARNDNGKVKVAMFSNAQSVSAYGESGRARRSPYGIPAGHLRLRK
jgi:hypothetical protein